MGDVIIDSKYRVQEPLAKAAGRQRFLVSDLVSGRPAILEYSPLDGFERMVPHWSERWLPGLRHRAQFYARFECAIPVSAIGTWLEGPYYVYGEEVEGEDRSEETFPDRDGMRRFLQDVAVLNAAGEPMLNLRPEYVRIRNGDVRILPGAYVLPVELLSRAGNWSPYLPPELRQAGMLSRATDGYTVAAVFNAVAERAGTTPPSWMTSLSRMQTLEPELRLDVETIGAILESGESVAEDAAPVRRAVESLQDLRLGEPDPAGRARPALEAIDMALAQLAEDHSTVLVLEGPPNGAGLKRVFLHLRQQLAFMAEKPRVFWIEDLTSWDVRDFNGSGPLVLLLPEHRSQEPAVLPVERLAHEKLHPCAIVLGVRAGAGAPGTHPERSAWLESVFGPDIAIRHLRLEAPPPPASAPDSTVAQQLLDLLCILEVDPTVDMLRQALPQQEEGLPEAIVELEQRGQVCRQLDAGGWWGSESRLVLRTLCPEFLEQRRQRLTPERREELHLLISNLLEHAEDRTLGHRYLRFQHLFAGGNWLAAAAACGPLLKLVQKRGLDRLSLHLQRRLVQSNLADHLAVADLLQVLRDLGEWEVEHGNLSEGLSFFERAAEKLFSVGEDAAADLDFAGTTELMLSHADVLERRGDVERALEHLRRYLDRFGERLSALARGRLFSEMAFCEHWLGRLMQAEERCQVALKLLDPRQNPADVAQVYSVLGVVRWKTSRYDEAEHYFSRSMALREKTGDKLAMARIYNNLGLLYRTMRRFPEALEFHRKSIEIREELGDEEGVARNVLNLAWVHFDMANLDHAEDLALRACHSVERMGASRMLASAKGLLGDIYLQRERWPEAREALAEAIRMARQHGDLAELFMDLRKHATLEVKLGNLDRAEELLREAEEHLPRAASPLEEAHWNLCFAELWMARRNWRAAAAAFENAGNGLARLGNAQQAAESFVSATRQYLASGLASRARDLVARARQLFMRDRSIVLPRELLDLEDQLGTGDGADSGDGQAISLLEILRRVTANMTTAGNDHEALEQVLVEVRSLAKAHCALFLDGQGQVHGASARDASSPPPPQVIELSRLAARALQADAPFGPEAMPDPEAYRPFYVIPVAVRDQRLGCVYLEWVETAALPASDVLGVLRTLAQQAALVLQQTDRHRKPAATVETATLPRIPAPPTPESGIESIVGRSAARQAVIDFVRQVRDLDATVLLMGENGTGKEVVARAIHDTGNRRSFDLVTLNCTAVPEGLWEREMFGHERGAFTDAGKGAVGLFEKAHRSTLLLDEIGDMPWEMQTKLLRVLEQKSFMRIGGTEIVHVDVRIVAATNQDLDAAVQAGRFRRDLFHRLDVLAITLPPLRDRREDIPELARHFLGLHAEKMGVRPKQISGEALRIMMRYSWPGNVRELENAMKASLVYSDREVLVPEDLPPPVLRGGEGPDSAGQLDIDSVAKWVLDHAAYSPGRPLMPDLQKALARQLVSKIGEKAMAARLLGITKPTLYTRLRS